MNFVEFVGCLKLDLFLFSGQPFPKLSHATSIATQILVKIDLEGFKFEMGHNTCPWVN